MNRLCTTRHALVVAMVAICALTTSSCGKKKTTPITATDAVTKIINVSGNMAFGSVEVGTTKTSILTVENTGNSTLTLTGATGGNAILSVLTFSTPAGPYGTTGQSVPVAAGGKLEITVSF